MWDRTHSYAGDGGAIVIYFVATKLRRVAIVKFNRRIRGGEQKIERAEKWFTKYGPVTVFTSRMVSCTREIIRPLPAWAK
jgi:membrane protein DedA with SNARE-associated domain